MLPNTWPISNVLVCNLFCFILILFDSIRSTTIQFILIIFHHYNYPNYVTQRPKGGCFLLSTKDRSFSLWSKGGSVVTSLPVFLTAAVALHVLCRSFCLLSRFKIIIKRLFFKVTETISHLTRVEGNSLRTRLRIGLQHNLPPPCRSHISNCCETEAQSLL